MGETGQSFHLAFLKIGYNGDTFLPHQVDQFERDVLLHDDEVRIMHTQLLLKDLLRVLLNIYLRCDVWHVLLSNRAQKHDLGVYACGLHSFACNALTHNDSVDVGTLRTVLPVNQLHLDELVDVHRVVKDSGRWLDCLDGLHHEFNQHALPLVNAEIVQEKLFANDFLDVTLGVFLQPGQRSSVLIFIFIALIQAFIALQGP